MHDLQAFVDAWMAARFAKEQSMLQRLLTTREPHASRARGDLDLLSRAYLPIGLGMRAVLHPAQSEPFEGWETTVHPLAFRLTWSTDMSGRETDHAEMTIDRVGLEADGFKVISVFDDETRARATLEAELLARVRGR